MLNYLAYLGDAFLLNAVRRFDLDAHQPADFAGVRHQSLIDFLRGSPLGG